MATLPDGVYQIAFTDEQLLTAFGDRPGARLVLLPPGAEADGQEWQVQAGDEDTYTIRNRASQLYLSFDGEPDMHELALLSSEPRGWHLFPGEESGTYAIGVPGAEMRLGMSLLRIFPPHLALAPEYGDPYQAWTFNKIG